MVATNNFLDKLEAKLLLNSALKWQKSETSLRIEAVDQTGFSITLYRTDVGRIVA